MILEIHHVALKCCGTVEFEKTVAFYREVLGIPVLRTWGAGTASGAMLQTGSGIIEIFASAESRLEQGAVRHFALATDDVDSAVRAVRAAGYAITVEPKDLVIPAQPPYPVRIAFFIGPVGEEVELFQER